MRDEINFHRSNPELLLVLAGFLCIALAGCSTTGSTARWYAPATWFSAAPAQAVDKAEARQDAARDAAIKAAQKLTHETAEALAVAPESRPVEVATESNAAAVALLDQAAGPLTATQLAQIRKQVTGLISENAALRAEAEKARDRARAADSALSDRLAQADAQVRTMEGKLREAWNKENALANELRSQRALAWIAGAIALLAAAGWLYVKIALGGLPGAMASGLAVLRAQGAIPPKGEPNIFDSFLNRNEQAALARLAP